VISRFVGKTPNYNIGKFQQYVKYFDKFNILVKLTNKTELIMVTCGVLS